MRPILLEYKMNWFILKSSCFHIFYLKFNVFTLQQSDEIVCLFLFYE